MRFLKRLMPSQDQLAEHRFARWFGQALTHPGVFAWNRRSVAGGVAAGLFCGLIPGPFQVLATFACAWAFRINLPIAIVSTFYTNPVTIVPIYFLALQLGERVLGARGGPPPAPPPDIVWSDMAGSITAWFHWTASLGMPLALGVFLLACLLALVGYFAVRIGWTWHTQFKLRGRRRSRAAQAGGTVTRSDRPEA